MHGHSVLPAEIQDYAEETTKLEPGTFMLTGHARSPSEPTFHRSLNLNSSNDRTLYRSRASSFPTAAAATTRGRLKVLYRPQISVQYSCFDNVGNNYLEKSVSGMRFQPGFSSFPHPPQTPNGNGSPERTEHSFPTFSPPNAKDLAQLRFPVNFVVHRDTTPPLDGSESWAAAHDQTPCSLTLASPVSLLSKTSPEENGPDGQVAVTKTKRAAVRRKPVPRLEDHIQCHPSSFMRLSSLGSFPVFRPKYPLEPSPSAVAKVFRRSDTVRGYSLRYFLSQGAQGKVYVATSGTPMKVSAIKVISKLRVENFRTLLQEQNLLKRVKGHQFIVELVDSFHDTENFYLITDFYPGGDLAHLLSKLGVFETEMARFYIAELIVATRYLHGKHIVHRDLKPGNILIKANGHICLVDFGLCKDFQAPSAAIADPTDHHERVFPGSDSEKKPKWTGPTTNGFAGTLVYMSPQAVNQDAYSYDTDWWSVGIILYELLQGDTPWVGSDISTMVKKIRRDPIVFRKDVPLDSSARDFVERLLEKPVSMRLSPQLFEHHEFFRTYDFGDVEKALLTPPYIPTYHEGAWTNAVLTDRDKIYIGRSYEPGVDPFPEYNYDFVEAQPPSIDIELLARRAKEATVQSVESLTGCYTLPTRLGSQPRPPSSALARLVSLDSGIKGIARQVGSYLKPVEAHPNAMVFGKRSTTTTTTGDASDAAAVVLRRPTSRRTKKATVRPRSSMLEISSAVCKIFLDSLNHGIELQPCPPVAPIPSLASTSSPVVDLKQGRTTDSDQRSPVPCPWILPCPLSVAATCQDTPTTTTTTNLKNTMIPSHYPSSCSELNLQISPKGSPVAAAPCLSPPVSPSSFLTVSSSVARSNSLFSLNAVEGSTTQSTLPSSASSMMVVDTSFISFQDEPGLTGGCEAKPSVGHSQAGVVFTASASPGVPVDALPSPRRLLAPLPLPCVPPDVSGPERREDQSASVLVCQRDKTWIQRVVEMVEHAMKRIREYLYVVFPVLIVV